MLVFAKLFRLVGVDQLHTGTVIGKMKGENTPEINKFLREEWHGLKTTFPVASGGLHPGHVPELVRLLGKNIIIQAGGGVHGHPGGTLSGAMAMRQAIDAVMSNTTMKSYAGEHKELKQAMERWKF